MTRTPADKAGAKELTPQEAKAKRLEKMAKENEILRWLTALREQFHLLGDPYYSRWIDQYVDHAKLPLTKADMSRCYLIVNCRWVWSRNKKKDKELYDLLDASLAFAKATLEQRKNIEP